MRGLRGNNANIGCRNLYMLACVLIEPDVEGKTLTGFDFCNRLLCRLRFIIGFDQRCVSDKEIGHRYRQHYSKVPCARALFWISQSVA